MVSALPDGYHFDFVPRSVIFCVWMCYTHKRTLQKRTVFVMTTSCLVYMSAASVSIKTLKEAREKIPEK